MGRRKKTPKKSNDDSFDEELAIEIYRKRKSYERPENTGLETVLESEGKDEEKPESSTRVRAQRASRPQQGVQPKLRMINTQPYYLEDDDKTVLRKKQIAKLFKGRKKFKWKGLTTKQEDKLFLAISEKPDTDVDTSIDTDKEEDQEEKENLVVKTGTTPFIVNESTSLGSLSESRIDESLSFHTPLSSFASNTPLTEKTKATTLEKNDQVEVKIDVNTIKEADDFLGPLGFSDDEDSQSFTFKSIKVKKAEKENVQKDNDRRKSKITKVRRSSRLFRGQNPPSLTENTNNLGSSYHDMEIENKPCNRNSRRRSSKPKVPEFAMPSPKEPSTSDEALCLNVENIK